MMVRLELDPYPGFPIPKFCPFQRDHYPENAPITLLLGYNGLYVLNEDAYEDWTVLAYELPVD